MPCRILSARVPQDAIDSLVDEVGSERFTAEDEVRRSFNGTYSPLSTLKLGRIPVEMVRASLAAQTLTREYQPQWKFYAR